MRIVNIMCISKKKAVRHYADLIVKISEENSEITQAIEYRIPTKDLQVCDVLRPNWMFVDTREE